MSLKTSLDTLTSGAVVLFIMALAGLFLAEKGMGVVASMDQFPLVMAAGAGIVIVFVYVFDYITGRHDEMTL
jgi:hypothetical protein